MAPTQTPDQPLEFTTRRNKPQADEAPVVRIDGEAYELRRMDDLGVTDRVRVGRVGAHLQKLSAVDESGIADIDDDTLERLDLHLRQAVGIVLPDAPAAVLDDLDDEARVQVMARFFESMAPTTGSTPSASTSSKSSRASRGSTAAARRST